jgi:hypothetical protein
MKYKYVTSYQIRGLTHNPDRREEEIFVKEGNSSVRAILTGNLDAYCFEIDRAQAVGYLLLKGLVDKKESSDLSHELEAEMSRLRELRNKELNDSEKLVFIADGYAQAELSQPNRETDDYILGFQVVDKEKIFQAHSDQVNAALAALCLTAHEVIQVKHIRGDVYLINDSGKPIYSVEFSVSGKAYTSRRTTDEVIRETKGQVANLLMDKCSLSQVYKLLVQAISRDNDQLRRFMFGWSALEILINKVFSEYEKQFVQNLIGADPAIHTQRYFERIRDVMKGKYRLTDKFVVLAACVADNTVEEDIENFVEIKKSRDALLHGKAIDEKSLPDSETVALLKKYLRQHINAKTLNKKINPTGGT